MTETQNLLAEYIQTGSDAAFRELVARYVDLVFSSAIRLVDGDSHRAEDVAQTVFVDLARTAQTLPQNVMLGGWLHRHTCFVAMKTIRSERRRESRERQAVEMNALQDNSGSDFSHVAPILDEAINELGETDRTAILLRFFEQHDFRAVGQAIGANEDAARMRVTRALEKLELLLKHRGVTTSATVLPAVLSANAIQAAPVGLAVSISTVAALAGTTINTTTTAAALKTIAMTTLQKTLITVTVAAAVGTGIYQAHQASTLQSQVQTLRQQQASSDEKLMTLQNENERLSSELAEVEASRSLPNEQFTELLRLRGKAGVAQASSLELAKLKSTLAEQTGKMPDFMTNAMASGLATAEKFRKKDAEARLARMKKALNLTDDQAQAIGDIMQNHIQSQTQRSLDLMTGKATPEQLGMAGYRYTQEAEIQALFTFEQLAAYPEFQQAEKITAANNSAKNDASRIAKDFDLSKEQQEQVRASLYQMKMNEAASPPDQTAILSAKNGDLAEAANMSIELQKSKLDAKMESLRGILTADQIKSYRDEQMSRIDMQADAMKMFLPKKPVGTGN